jgi:hypothetical protein
MEPMDDTYLMLDSVGRVVPVDLGPMLRRHRAAHIRARADAIDQAVDLLMDEAFDLAQTWDACEASGMGSGAIDSAGNVALVLRRIEEFGSA